MSLIDNLKKFINIIDQLRDIGLDQHIQLPRIVVLGSQSSGKSSLLESIVGLDFLPRGDGLVTRRPLEMRLINVSKAQVEKPYAIFEEIKGEKFEDFDVVREKIIYLTDKVAGDNKNIVNNPIIITIYSPSCPDLTLVDLPGITRIPLHNSGQPENIEEITKNMALSYVKEPRTIILCVIPANADLSTSDGLKMAKEIDPTGARTLGVLTKIDIMDKGTNARRILMNQEIKLTMGYVAVKLRSQEDINSKLDIKKSLENERNFFATNSIYSTLP